MPDCPIFCGSTRTMSFARRSCATSATPWSRLSGKTSSTNIRRVLRAEACAPIQNKLGALLSDPTLYRILVEPQIDLHFRALMDDGMILLVNVSKGTARRGQRAVAREPGGLYDWGSRPSAVPRASPKRAGRSSCISTNSTISRHSCSPI